MRLTSFSSAVLLCFLALTACAQGKKAGRASASLPPEVKSATYQKTIPGRRESGSFSLYRFVIVWKGKTPPNEIFFRPDADTWLDVKCARRERKPMGMGEGNNYMEVEVNVPFKNIRQGQEIIVNPEREAHDLIPAAVKKMPVNALYWTTTDAPKKWHYLQMKIQRLPDIQGM